MTDGDVGSGNWLGGDWATFPCLRAGWEDVTIGEYVFSRGVP